MPPIRNITIGFLYFLGVLVAYMALMTVGPVIETTWFPVYSRFKIESIERIPPNNSLITASYTKFRDCVPIGAAWYNSPVSRDLENARQLDYLPRRRIGLQKSPPKPIGKWDTQPFELSATPEEVASTVFAEVFSRCHFLWMTRSVIYP